MKKLCTKCNTEKELNTDNFYWRKKRTIFNNECIECSKARVKKLYRENGKYKNDAIKRQERYREQSRVFVLAYLKENPCVDCGEKDPIVLQFDHTDPTQKTKAVSIMIRNYHPETVKKEIDKCEVRCANCHIRKTSKQFNWWKNEA